MTFTAKDLLDTVIRIGKENSDFVYTEQEGRDSDDQCGYTGNRQGSTEGSPCIVGKALMEHGADPDYLQYAFDGADEVVPRFVRDKDQDVESLHTLRIIQIKQDRGESWGEAVDGSPI